MNDGLLWYVSPKEDMVTAIGEAVKIYEKKYSRKVAVILMNPKDLSAMPVEMAGLDDIVFRPWQAVVSKHLILCVDDEPEYAKDIRDVMEKSREENL